MLFGRHKKQAYPKKKKLPSRRRTSSRLRPETAMLIKQVIIGIVAIATTASVMAGVWYGTRAAAVTITSVRVEGGVTIDLVRVEAVVREQLDGTYGKMIPRAFSYFYPHDDIVTAVSAIPRVKDPVVVRDSRTSLYVTIDEYIPYALWCGERTGGQCYFIDDRGYAFSEAPDLIGSAFIRYHTLGRIPELGATLTDSEQLTAVEAVIKGLLREFGFPVLTVELDLAGDEFYILPGTSELRVSRTIHPDMTLQNLAAVLSADEFSALTPGTFSYIDLRFGSKVFVNDTMPGLATTTATSTATSSQNNSAE